MGRNAALTISALLGFLLFISSLGEGHELTQLTPCQPSSLCTFLAVESEKLKVTLPKSQDEN